MNSESSQESPRRSRLNPFALNLPRPFSAPFLVPFSRRFISKGALGIVMGLLFLGWTSSCAPEALDDFNDLSIPLVDQNGETVVFPDDLKGKPVVMGFIYTHCPDICSLITANILQIQKESGADAHFVLITFDPTRDTPEALKRYADAFDMDRSPFLFLTGGAENIQKVMDRMRVRTSISYRQTIDSGEEVYFMNHSDKLMLLDADSRLIVEYGGSMTPPALVEEDLANL